MNLIANSGIEIVMYTLEVEVKRGGKEYSVNFVKLNSN